MQGRYRGWRRYTYVALITFGGSLVIILLPEPVETAAAASGLITFGLFLYDRTGFR